MMRALRARLQASSSAQIRQHTWQILTLQVPFRGLACVHTSVDGPLTVSSRYYGVRGIGLALRSNCLAQTTEYKPRTLYRCGKNETQVQFNLHLLMNYLIRFPHHMTLAQENGGRVFWVSFFPGPGSNLLKRETF
jgi:hypothetical protein